MNLSLVAARPRKLSMLGRFKLRTFDLYVARLYLQAYGVCFVSFVGLYILFEAFAKLDRFLRQDASLFTSLFKYYVAMVPTVYVNYMGPILTLAAGMFAITSLNRQNELTPVKAAGISVYRLVAPIFVLAAAIMVGSFLLKDKVLPRLKDPIRAALSMSRGSHLNPLPYFDKDHAFLIYVHEYSPTGKVAHTVEISELHPNGRVKEQIDANQMVWVPCGKEELGGGTWVLHEGSIQKWDEEGNLVVNTSASRFERLKEPFKRRELDTSLQPIDLETSDVEISYLSWEDLKRQYQRQPYHRHLAVKLHHHFAFPLAHLVLLFLGLPFVLNLSNRSTFVSLAISFVICALYYLVSSICMNIANQSEGLSPILAAWLPVMLFGALGMTLFDHLPT